MLREPHPLRFRLRRKLRYDGDFFAFQPQTLRWFSGGGGMGDAGRELHLFCQHRTSHDNPNAVLQVGDGFGFIISIGNIL